MKAYEKISSHGYTRDQLHFRREHTGDLEHTGPAIRSLMPFVGAAAFALGLGGLLIIKAQNAPVALGGLGCCFVGLVLVWFIGQQVAHHE